MYITKWIQVAAPQHLGLQVPETVVASLLPKQQVLSSNRVTRTFHGKPSMAPLFGVSPVSNQHFITKH